MRERLLETLCMTGAFGVGWFVGTLLRRAPQPARAPRVPAAEVRPDA